MEIYTNIDQIDIEQWTDLLKKSDTASFFSSKECYNFYKSLSFFDEFVFAVSHNGKLQGVVVGYIQQEGGLLKRFFTRRAIIPGGVLLSPDISKDALSLLLSTMKKQLTRKAIYIEFRNYNDYNQFKVTFEKEQFKYEPHLNFHVASNDVESALMNLNSTKRRDVKISKKEGAEIILASKEEEVLEFYEILDDLYKTKIKTPLFSYEFFQKLFYSDFGKIVLIRYQNKIIGGSICVELENKTLYEWFVCGLDRQFKNVYPSTLATWGAIEYAASHGLARFDMMGAGKEGDGYGVRDFKSKFGGQLVEHGRFIYIADKMLFEIGKLGVKLLKGRN